MWVGTANVLGQISVQLDPVTLCPGECHEITVSVTGTTPPISYQWSAPDASTFPLLQAGPADLPTLSVCMPAEGTPAPLALHLDVTDDAGAMGAANTEVSSLPAPAVDFAWFPEEPMLGEPVTFRTLGNDDAAATWQFSDADFVGNNTTGMGSEVLVAFDQPGSQIVEVAVTNDHGCAADTAHRLEVQPTVYLFVPSAFTPNQDGLNDGFKVHGTYIEEYSIAILNRWGNTVYTSTDIHQGWAGGQQETLIADGPYTYWIQYRDRAGILRERRGMLNAFR